MTIFHVYRSSDRRCGSRTFGVYAQPASDGTGQELVEGGFFTKAAALEAKARWERELLADVVKKAERAAGWDPNP